MTVRRALCEQSRRLQWTGGEYSREVVLADLDLAGDLSPSHAHITVNRRGLLFLFALGEQAPWRMLATQRARSSQPAYTWPGHPVPSAELQRLIDAAGLSGQITRVALVCPGRSCSIDSPHAFSRGRYSLQATPRTRIRPRADKA